MRKSVNEKRCKKGGAKIPFRKGKPKNLAVWLNLF